MRETLGLIAGFGLWSLAFVALYGLHGLGCGIGIAPGGLRAALVLLLGLFLAGHVVLAAWLMRVIHDRFLRAASLVLAVGAGATTLWTGIPVALLSICV